MATQVRGFETAQTSFTLPSGFSIPLRGGQGQGKNAAPAASSAGARLELHETDVVVAPNAFIPLLNVSAGREALIFALGLGLETSPPWGTQIDGKLVVRNNYVEGCWSLLRTHDEVLPGHSPYLVRGRDENDDHF